MIPSTVDVDGVSVPTLVPPQLPAFLLGQGNTYRYSPREPRKDPNPPQLTWAPLDFKQRRVTGTNAGNSTNASPCTGSHGGASSRRTPTANGAAPGDCSSFLHQPKSPVDIFLRAAGGAGAGLGASGLFCGPARAHWLRLWPFPGRRRGSCCSEKREKVVLIMMSNTGGGHKASAEALAQVFREMYGDEYRVHVVDMWKEHTPWPFNQLPDSYSFLVKHSFLWRTAYYMLQPPLIHVPYFAACNAFCSRMLTEAFNRYKPDLVVSVHPLMQHVPVRVLQARAVAQGTQPPPFATVVTDFTTCHNSWFCPAVDRCFVATDFTRDLALSLGMSAEQVKVYGLPIRPEFAKNLGGKPQLRNRLGLVRDLPAVLLVGGGEGMGRLEETVEQLDRQLQGSAQLVVVCGRNRKLLASLAAREWPGHSHVQPLGFVNNMHEWMRAADVIITKAGPGTIAEALICGLPILLNGNIPCQEEGNVPWVVDNGVGAFQTDPAAIAATIADWLGPSRAALAAMAGRARQLGRPDAVCDIVRDLATLCGARLAARGAEGAVQARRRPRGALAITALAA